MRSCCPEHAVGCRRHGQQIGAEARVVPDRQVVVNTISNQFDLSITTRRHGIPTVNERRNKNKRRS